MPGIKGGLEAQVHGVRSQESAEVIFLFSLFSSKCSNHREMKSGESEDKPSPTLLKESRTPGVKDSYSPVGTREKGITASPHAPDLGQQTTFLVDRAWGLPWALKRGCSVGFGIQRYLPKPELQAKQNSGAYRGFRERHESTQYFGTFGIGSTLEAVKNPCFQEC